MKKYALLLVLVFLGVGCSSGTPTIQSKAQGQDMMTSETTSTARYVGKLIFTRKIEDDFVGHVDVDVPVVQDFQDKTFEQNMNWYLETSLDVDVNNWHRVPDSFLHEKNVIQRRCSPIAINNLEILFRCTVQIWYGKQNVPYSPYTTTYGLRLPAGEWMSTQEAEQRAALY